jgi:tetratricopeptide (TPR) repeat protein
LSRRIGDLALENHCLEALAHVERELGRMDEVASLEAERVDVQERQGNQPAAAQDALQHGSTLLSLGRLDQARAAFQRGLELSRAAGDEQLEQRAYGGLGVTFSQSNMPVEALNHLMLALDLARANEDTTHEAQWLASIGEALWKFDQPEDAIKALRQAITAAERIDDVDLQAGTLSLLGQIHGSIRQPELAARDYQAALDLYRLVGDAEAEIQTLSALGVLAMEGNDAAGAITLYDEALQQAARTDHRAAAVRIYGRLARLAQRQGDEDAALEALEQAAVLAETIPNQRPLYGQALQHLAVAQDAAGLPMAMDTYEEALDVAREVGDLYGETMMLVNVGARLLSLGVQEDGAHILEHAIRLSEDLGPMGMKLRQRAEGLLMSVRTSSMQGGSRQRERTSPGSRPGSGAASRSVGVPSAAAITPRQGQPPSRTTTTPRP